MKNLVASENVKAICAVIKMWQKSVHPNYHKRKLSHENSQ
jgi:hypothetical protein